MLPAALSTVSLGGALAARVAVGKLMPLLFLLSIGILGYAHYRAWWGHGSHRTGRIVLVVNTVLVMLLWFDRTRSWLA